ncbi:hypothetical protein STANM309S_06667 [Streptomyces tanashiensis]
MARLSYLDCHFVTSVEPGDRDYYRHLLPSPFSRLPRTGPVGYRRQAARLAAGRDGEVHPGATSSSPARRRRPPSRLHPHLRPDPHHVVQQPPPWALTFTPTETQAVGGSGGTDRDRAGPRLQRGPAQQGRHATASPSRRRPAPPPNADRARPSSSSTRSTTPEIQVLGRGLPGGLRAGHPAPRPHRHALPVGHQPDPLRHVRGGQRRHPPVVGRLHLRLRQRPRRRRRPAGHLPLLQRQALAHQAATTSPPASASR